MTDTLPDSSQARRLFRERKLGPRVVRAARPLMDRNMRLFGRLRHWLAGLAATLVPTRDERPAKPLSPRMIERACRRQGFAWLAEEMAVGDCQDRRGDQGLGAGLPARCRDRSGAVWTGRLRARAQGGLTIDGSSPLAIDETLDVALEGFGTFTCRVTASEGDRLVLAPIGLTADDAAALIGRLRGTPPGA